MVMNEVPSFTQGHLYVLITQRTWQSELHQQRVAQ
jgi:hypothetical protein